MNNKIPFAVQAKISRKQFAEKIYGDSKEGYIQEVDRSIDKFSNSFKCMK